MNGFFALSRLLIRRSVMRMAKVFRFAIVMLVVSTAFGTASAQREVKGKRLASVTGIVEIFNPFGSVRVVGWDRNEVAVTGTLGEGVEYLNFTGNLSRTEVRVVSGQDSAGSVPLEVHVPANSRVEVKGSDLDINVSKVAGMLKLESVRGDIQVAGRPREIHARSHRGSVGISALGSRVQVATMQSSVTLRMMGGEVDVSTVSGKIRVDGEGLNGRFESVSGDIEIAASGSKVQVESGNGSVTLLWKGGEVDVSTMSGSIVATGDQLERGRFESYTGNIEFESGSERNGKLNFKAHQGEVKLQVPGTSSEVSVSTGRGNITVVGEGFERGWFESKSGDIRFEGSVSRNSTLDFQTTGGIDLLLPEEVEANFNISTGAGTIQNEFGPKARPSPLGQKLNFSTKSVGTWISVKANRDVRLRKRAEKTEESSRQSDTE